MREVQEGHIVGENLVRMVIEVLAGPVGSHCGSGRRDGGDRTSRRPVFGVETALAKVWRSMCGRNLMTWMPTVSARRRRRRTAACRSIRAPRHLGRIGPPIREPIASSVAKLSAGGNRTFDTLA